MQFEGDPSRRTEFDGSFQVTVDNNISSIQKFNYMLSCLKGRTQSVGALYAITRENYTVVVDVFKRRLGNPECKLHALHLELKHLKPADEEKIREAVEDIKRIQRHLDAMAENTEHPQIEMVIESKSPK